MLTTVFDHAQNLVFRARVLYFPIIITRVCPLEILQQSWVMYAISADTAFGSHASLRLLHYGRHDEPVIHPRLVRNLLDRIVQVLCFLCIVVGLVIEDIAGPGYYVRVRNPHVVEGHPVLLRRPARRLRSVA